MVSRNEDFVAPQGFRLFDTIDAFNFQKEALTLHLKISYHKLGLATVALAYINITQGKGLPLLTWLQIGKNLNAPLQALGFDDLAYFQKFHGLFDDFQNGSLMELG